jgi:dTDP-4-dehydrorhamnose reductase
MMNAETTAPKRLLVTGANGFVAGSVLVQAGEDWQLHAVSRGEPHARLNNLRWHVCDPCAPDQLARIFREVQPDVVIHTAAAADIDFCERQREVARAINVEMTRTVAGLCGDAGCKLVFCSTDTIFDGEHAPYNEVAAPGPVNFYAETKVEAERIVSDLGAQAVIARLSLVAGLPLLGAGNAFLPRLLAALKDGRSVPTPAHEIRTPVDVITVGRALLELAADEHHGIFHLAGHDRLSRFGMAQKIAARFGFAPELIVAQPPAPTPGRAPRPRDVSLDNAKACANLKTPMRTFDEALSLIQQTAVAPPT